MAALLRLRSLDSIDKQLLRINGKISALEVRLGENENTVKSIHKTVSDLEECKNFDSVKLAELCDDQKRLDHTQSQIQNELRKTREQNTKIQEELIELRGRSMRDNLLFFNFPEQTHNQRNEACIDKIFDFCELELDIANVRQNVKIDLAHRIGQPRPNKIRPIVAKFNYNVPPGQRNNKKAAAEKLRNSRYSVGDQYPVEIQQRRRKLVPVLKQAQSEVKRAILVYDKLYINDSRYVEQSQDGNMVGHQRGSERHTQRNEFGYYQRASDERRGGVSVNEQQSHSECRNRDVDHSFNQRWRVERRVHDNALGEHNKQQYTRGHEQPCLSLFCRNEKSVPKTSNMFALLETMEDDVDATSTSAQSSSGQNTNNMLRRLTLLGNIENHGDVDATSTSARSSSGLNTNGPTSYGSAIGAVVESTLLDSNMDINANDMSTPDSILGAVGGATPLVAPSIDKLCDGPTTKQGNSAGSTDQSA